MAFILKTVEHANSPVDSDNECGLYADIVSVHFRRSVDGSAEAFCYMREPVKTAEVPGHHEVEKHIVFSGTAYVMNEQGKTIQSFTARTSAQQLTASIGQVAA